MNVFSSTRLEIMHRPSNDSNWERDDDDEDDLLFRREDVIVVYGEIIMCHEFSDHCVILLRMCRMISISARCCNLIEEL